MWKGKKVSVVFSTYNEKETIRQQIEAFFETKVVDEVIVVDNNAIRGTREEVLKTKAKYFHEPRQGIGWGFQRALKEATGDLIITTEVDGTYVPRDIFKFLAYSEDFEVVLGTRTTSIMIGKGANMGFAMKWANWGFAKILEVLFGTSNLTDVGCIYRLITRRVYNKIKNSPMHKKNSYNIDFLLHIIRSRIPFIEIPVNFKKRVGQSHGAANTWKAFKVAVGMALVIVKHRFNIKKSPLFTAH
jgi:glycosyltransferase involved in cell wall biosynthesis